MKNEEEPVHRRTDCLRAQAGGTGHSGARDLPEAGIAEQTFYRWRSKYAGMLPSDLKRLKQLEEENGKLKRLVADLSLN